MASLSRRGVAAVGVLLAVGAASLIGGVGVGRATTSFTWSFKAYNTNSGNTIPAVTYGGAMGFHLEVQNSDTSNATHVLVVVHATSSATSNAAFLDASDPSCVAATGDTSTMVCTPFGGTMVAGVTYKIDFRFTAPSVDATITMTPSVVISAQSVGGKNHGDSGTTASTGTPATTDVIAGNGNTTDTFIRNRDGQVTTNGPQTFTIGMPPGLIGNPFAVAVGVQNMTGAIPGCATCLQKFTQLTIPTAQTFGEAGNPFYDGTDTDTIAYPWTMTATYSGNFTLHGVFHLPDAGGGPAEFIPACSSLPGGVPNNFHPVCYLTLVQDRPHKTLTATGLGIENGNGGFG